MDQGLGMQAMSPEEQMMMKQGGDVNSMGQAPAMPSQASPEMVQEIAQLLLQGITPEELIQQGVPPELVEQAIMMLESQEGMQGGEMGPPAPPPEAMTPPAPSAQEILGGGLASQY